MNCAQACDTILCSLDDLQPLLKDHWEDCYRLCQRCSVFRPFISSLMQDATILERNENSEIQIIEELEKTLLSICKFVTDFSQRTCFYGLTEQSARQSYINDITKYTHQVTRLCSALNLPTEEYDARRKEDLRDSRSSFQYAVLKALDEISRGVNVENISEFSNLCDELERDIKKQEEVVEKTLALFKHIPLSVTETRSLRVDSGTLLSLVNARKKEVVAALASSKPQPIPVTSPTKPVLHIDVPDKAAAETQAATDTPYIQSRITIDNLSRIVFSGSFSPRSFSERDSVLQELQLPASAVTVKNVKLGKGAFSDVYLGNLFKDQVAIKSFRVTNLGREEQVRNFENEVLVMRYLGEHPTIVSSYGYLSNDSTNSFKLVLELAPYGSLSSILFDRVAFSSSFPLSLNIAWMTDIINALKFLHSKQIIHCDVKAENCLIFGRMRLKLSDFGPAHQFNTEQKAQRLSGTFPFVAPEVRMGGRAEYSSDIFSFAMTTLQIFTRQQPHSDDCHGQVLEALSLYTFPSIEIQDHLAALLLNCIEYDNNSLLHSERPSAAHVSAQLEELLAAIGGDPRNFAGPEDFVDAVEGIAKGVAAQRMQTNELQAESASVANLSSPVPSAGYLSPTNAMVTPATCPSVSGSVFSYGIYCSPYQTEDAADRMALAQFLLGNTSLASNPEKAHQLADLLVRKGVAAPATLRRRMVRNRKYLQELGFPLDIAKQLEAVLVHNSPAPERPPTTSGCFTINEDDESVFSAVKKHESNPMYRPSTERMDTSFTKEDRPPSPMSCSSTIFTNPEADDHTVMLNFLQDEVRCAPDLSQQYAAVLVRHGMRNINALKRRLVINHHCLEDLGVDEETAKEVRDYLDSSDTGVMQGNLYTGSGLGLSMYQKSTLSPKLSMGGGTNSVSRSRMRRASSAYFTTGSDVIPTEIARMYYEATQCYRKEAFEKLSAVAENDDDNLAWGFLMRIYATGQANLPKERARAEEIGTNLMPWLKEAIENGGELVTMYAKYFIGVCYDEGLGTNVDHREAFRWYKMSAEQGYAGAQAIVGYSYFFGKGTNRNLEESVRYYRLAAEQGYAGAQCNLGLAYEHGYGVPRNHNEAFRWYSLAAQQGEAAALYNVGFCFENGIGVERDLVEAFDHFYQSALLGYTAAIHCVGMCCFEGQGTIMDKVGAIDWFLQAAKEKNYAPAQCKLAMCYEAGHGVDLDHGEAVRWYRQAAEQSYPAAMYYLGYCYFAGVGISRDLVSAVYWYDRAAEKGFAAAQNNLGFCYFNGVGVVKDLKKAVQWYRAAADQGYAAAQYNLGYCYEKGLGVNTKLNEVIKWYRLAADNGNDKARKALTKITST